MTLQNFIEASITDLYRMTKKSESGEVQDQSLDARLMKGWVVLGNLFRQTWQTTITEAFTTLRLLAPHTAQSSTDIKCSKWGFLHPSRHSIKTLASTCSSSNLRSSHQITTLMEAHRTPVNSRTIESCLIRDHSTWCSLQHSTTDAAPTHSVSQATIISSTAPTWCRIGTAHQHRSHWTAKNYPTTSITFHAVVLTQTLPYLLTSIQISFTVGTSLRPPPRQPAYPSYLKAREWCLRWRQTQHSSYLPIKCQVWATQQLATNQ